MGLKKRKRKRKKRNRRRKRIRKRVKKKRGKRRKKRKGDEDSERSDPEPGREPTLKEILGIPEHEKINKSILRRIKNARIGNNIVLPTDQGRDRVDVTSGLKKKVMGTWNRHYASDEKEERVLNQEGEESGEDVGGKRSNRDKHRSRNRNRGNRGLRPRRKQREPEEEGEEDVSEG